MSDSRTYDEVLREIERLKAEAEQLRKNEIKTAVAEAKAIIAKYKLTADDLGLQTGKTKAKAVVRDVKFRSDTNPDDTYGGKGPLPGWLKQKLAEGRSKEEFRV